MRLLFLLLLVACQPEVPQRSVVSAGTLNEDSLIGVWKTDLGSCYVLSNDDVPCSRVVRMTFTETTLKAVVINVETGQPFSTPLRSNSIKFMSGSSYYDYKLNETVSYEVNGNKAKVCYDLGCNNLYR